MRALVPPVGRKGEGAAGGYGRKITPRVFLAGAILLFCGFQIVVSVHKYLNLLAASEDLGYIEQMLWMISHGNLWAFTTVFQAPALGDTFSLILYPLAIIHRYLGGVYALFVLQAMGTGSAAWGIFEIARIKGLGERTSAIVATLFLFYPAIIGGSQFDFHVDFIALPLFIWAYLFYRRGKTGAYYICLAAAIFCKDIGGLVVGAWGVGLIAERKRRDGIVALGLGASIFILEVGILMPHYFRGQTLNLDLSLYGYLGEGPMGILAGIFTKAAVVLHHLMGRSIYILRIFLPVAFLPLLGSAALAPTLVLFMFNYLSSLHAQQRVDDQYQIILSGWVYMASIEALAKVRKRKRQWWLAGAATLSIFQEGVIMSGLIIPLMMTHSGQLPFVQKAAKGIPRNSVVYTQNALGPQVYAHAVWGADLNAIRGVSIDTLPLLWQDGQRDFGTERTAILTLIPATPYISQVIDRAMDHGYQVTFGSGRVYVVSGNGTFRVPPPGTGWGRQSSRFPQRFPGWTQRVNKGVISRQHHWLESRPGEAGWILGGPLLRLAPGRYEVAFHFVPIGPPSGVVVGKAVVLGTSAREAVYQGRKTVRLHFVVGAKVKGHRRRVLPALRANGRAVLRLSYLRLSRI
ncbi:MAG: DUF2079 domain-containing protein [Thermaerobacter sp.]|nr:DUF2079 domain-containing protein [Thermaerobacter sp.]